MAGNAKSILAGEDYQHLHSWVRVLELLDGDIVERVHVEDSCGTHYDDITVWRRGDFPPQFIQVKWRESESATFSTSELTKASGRRRSLLEKAYKSWAELAGGGTTNAELVLISNASWHDPAAEGLIKNERLSDDFITGGLYLCLRDTWIEHIDTDQARFAAFARCMRFRFGESGFDGVAVLARERLRRLGLQFDQNALLAGVSIVRDAIRNDDGEFDRARVDRVVSERNLSAQIRTTSVSFVTIATSPDRQRSDYELDLRDKFQLVGDVRGHRLRDGVCWDSLAEELRQFREKVRSEGASSRLRAFGKSRLGPWFAFGHTFSQVAGYRIEVEHYGGFWVAGGDQQSDLEVVAVETDDARPADINVVAISVTNDVMPAVAAQLEERDLDARILHISLSGGLGPEALRDGADATRLALRARTAIREFSSRATSTTVVTELYYSGPAPGAAILGHYFNALGTDLTVMEFDRGRYLPTFTLPTA